MHFTEQDFQEMVAKVGVGLAVYAYDTSLPPAVVNALTVADWFKVWNAVSYGTSLKDTALARAPLPLPF